MNARIREGRKECKNGKKRNKSRVKISSKGQEGRRKEGAREREREAVVLWPHWAEERASCLHSKKALNVEARWKMLWRLKTQTPGACPIKLSPAAADG
jgi:hypothetical protein